MSKSRTISGLKLRRPTFKPLVEQMESRRLLATAQVDDSFAADDPAHHRFTTIQAAVNASNPGDTIRVKPGTYNESVTVDKQLTIDAEHDAAHDGRTDKKPHVKNASIVEIPAGGSYGFNLTANDIVIRGFQIQDSDDNGNPAGADGIVMPGTSSGDRILNNLITGTTMGLYLNSSGAHRTTVKGNVFDSNNQAGAAAGNGIYSDQGLSNARIEKNTFTGQENASIILVGGGPVSPPATPTVQSDILIRDNTMTDDAPIIVANLTHSEISHNTMVHPNGSGIFLAGGSSDVTIKNNSLTGGADTFTGINLRFDPVDYPVTTPNTDILIQNNDISDFGDAGIRLREGTNHVTLQNNRVQHNGTAGGGLGGITVEGSSNNTVLNNIARSNNGDGILLMNANTNTIQNNTANSNTGDGIHLTGTSSGNTVTKNTAQKNGGFDLHDDSTGPNTWTKNKAGTRNPPTLG
jgi:parallel beta-helix repeat protein